MAYSKQEWKDWLSDGRTQYFLDKVAEGIEATKERLVGEDVFTGNEALRLMAKCQGAVFAYDSVISIAQELSGEGEDHVV